MLIGTCVCVAYTRCLLRVLIYVGASVWFVFGCGVVLVLCKVRVRLYYLMVYDMCVWCAYTLVVMLVVCFR